MQGTFCNRITMAVQAALVLLLMFGFGCLFYPTNPGIINCCNGDNCECQDDNCTSLENMLDRLNNNSILELTNGSYNLTKPTYFTRLSNITIKGQGLQYTHILCKHMEAGFIFNESSHVWLLDFSMDSCGINTNGENNFIGNASKSVIIKNSNNVSLERVVIANSHGYGLLLYNSFGYVLLNGCIFSNNTVNWPGLETTHGGGGLLIVFSKQKWSNYTIIKGTFESNSANVELQKRSIYSSHVPERGGGIHLIFENSLDIHVHIDNSIFLNNNGTYGGGLHALFTGSSRNCHLTVSNSEFTANHAEVYGGGGINVGYAMRHTKNKYPTNNSMLFRSVAFRNNIGYIGGGASVFTSSVETEQRNNVTFDNCTFINNQATGGAAIDVRPGVMVSQLGTSFITHVSFMDCQFLENAPSPVNTNDLTLSTIFITSQVPISFSHNTTFHNNKATALYAASALLTFEEYSSAIFVNNSGEKGGAIHLEGESKILLRNNTRFQFINNTASYGGAICALPTQVHGFTFTDSCFLLPEDPHGKENITFHFNGNRASTKVGSNIFASSLAPCLGLCQYRAKQNLSTADVFSHYCIGNFSYDEEAINSSSIATCPSTLEYPSSNIHPVPGIPLALNINQIDEMGNNINDLFLITAQLQPTIPGVSLEHAILMNHLITINGPPGKSGSLILQNNARMSRRMTLNFTLAHCPPGLTLQEGNNICACSAFNDQQHYFGISCHSNAAMITLGFWTGYLGENKSDVTLFTGTCVVEFCNFNHRSKTYGHYYLPHKSCSKEELEKTVCGNTRKGILCGSCNEGFSMFYHSPYYTCHNTSISGCSYGIPIYIASELLPVTILFLIILLFNIRLTSGSLYSFVFYAQVLEFLFVDAFGTVEIKNNAIKLILDAVRIMYGTFNFKWLSVEGLSFCLIENATAMDLYMFRYGTTLYAVLLVLFTVLILRVHSCHRCVKLCRQCGRRNIRGSIVDGLSAFLVLCYFQCTQTTFQILTPVTLWGLGERRDRTVPLFHGDSEYFGNGHLPYAIPALFCFLVVIIPLPCILLLEPVLTKLFSLQMCRASVKDAYSKLRMNFMPFLDSFQGCFKDNYRFFAGLYFAYRVFIPILFLSQTVTALYAHVEILLFVIVFVHVSLRPYKKSWHNLLESGILLNLLLVNSITIFNYAGTIWGGVDSSKETYPLAWVQTFVLSLPLVYLVAYTSISVYHNIKACSNREQEAASTSCVPNYLEGFPARLLESKSNYDTF